MAEILLLNGANLNLLGTREPDTYGPTTLAEIEAAICKQGKALGYEVAAFQSNSESALVDRVQAAAGKVSFILLNPGAYTHTSIALRDALLAVDIPFIEIHISNVHGREDFRQQSYFSDIASGTITGLGTLGYELALQGAHAFLQQSG